MKKEMGKYFERLLKWWSDYNNSLPITSWDEEISPLLYVGEMNDDEEICWNPIEKNIIHDFTIVEEELGITLHEDIKKYYNSFWFFELYGIYKDCTIMLYNVVPGTDIINDFKENLKMYMEAHNERLDNIPIGSDENSLIVVIDNKTGNAKLEDYEKKTFKIISPNLEELIENLNN